MSEAIRFVGGVAMGLATAHYISQALDETIGKAQLLAAPTDTVHWVVYDFLGDACGVPPTVTFTIFFLAATVIIIRFLYYNVEWV